MKVSWNIQLQTILLLLFTTFTVAWPVWPRWLPDLDSLVVRQNSDTTTSSSSGTTTHTTGTSSSNTAKATATGTQSTTTQTSGKTSSTGKSSSSSTTKKATSTSVNILLPAGGVSMVTPAVASGAQYFKIGDFVTFAWNYTSLQVTPTAVNILATCTANNQMYTLAANATLPANGSVQAVTWDTGSYQSTAVSNPLLTETYTLVIYDAASSISATAQAGYLAVYEQYTFGMYTPQPYTPINEFVCVTCSSALSDMERRALSVVVIVSVITVMSFTWFVGGSGVIW